MSTGTLKMQYAHSEGHTCISFAPEQDGTYLTCGADGDLRVWPGSRNEDPRSECLGETATALATSTDVIYTACDNNFLQMYTYPELKRNGVVTRFTAPITDVDVNSVNIAAGSSDMTIQVAKLGTTEVKTLTGHLGPITGVALDPKNEYLVSSSCDSSIKIWNLSEGNLVKTIADIIPRCNDFFKAAALGRCSWNPTGEYFAIPKKREVVFCKREGWAIIGGLFHNSLYHNLSLVKFSPDGQFLAAGSVSGDVLIWHVESKKLVLFYEHRKQTGICGLSWRFDNDSLAIADKSGQCCVLSDIQDMCNTIVTLSNELQEMGDLDDNEISIEEIKKKADLSRFGDDEDESRKSEGGESRHELVPFVNRIQMQEAFQPSSTPVHFQRRFMLWNSIGVIRCFNTEEEQSINIEFHDHSFHHDLHFNNTDDNIMAALSHKLIALACPKTDDLNPSKLTAILLNSFDGTKQWSLNMPISEEIMAIAASGDWVAVATNLYHLRLFSWTGLQRGPIALPGKVVTMAGSENLLAVVYHQGEGYNEAQNLGVVMYDITRLTIRVILQAQALPISPASFLRWLGFTDQQRLCSYDSCGILRVLAPDQKHWEILSDLSFANNDHYFVIKVSELYQKIQCILCKGSYFPMTTPRPVTVEIDIKLPLCEEDTEKTKLEETFWRLLPSLPGLSEKEFDKVYKTAVQTIIKLFAHACRSNFDARALNMAQWMEEGALELAIKYATKAGRVNLVGKLNGVRPVEWLEELKGCFGGGETKEAPLTIEETSQRDLFENSIEEQNVNRILLAEQEDNSENNISPFVVTNDNPFRVTKKTEEPKGLKFFERSNPKKNADHKTEPKLLAPKVSKSKDKLVTRKKPTFIEWFGTQKNQLSEQFPGLSIADLTKIGMKRFRELQVDDDDATQLSESAKRKFEQSSEGADDIYSKIARFENTGDD